ncbi:MAG TPA: TonB-dependent receptor [Nevskiaceae bacterium]|nr:TonB-dependent receptor [Nevskiaceae bacterium]
MALAIAGAFATTAVAQQTAPPPAGASTTTKTDDSVQLEKVEVTGSRIKRVDVEGPAPVVTIDRSTIEKSGYTSVQDILRDLNQNTGGTVDQSFTFGFTPGAAGVDLRGFGSGRSLVLVDGRRLPAYPIGISGTDQFVDLSQIPTVMVERIEVLTDGASAIYGSDAISGVVNIITRKNMQGSSASARVGGTQHGGGSNQKFEFATGVSGAESSLAFFADYARNNPLWIRDRDYSESDFTGGGLGSAFGSTFLGIGDTGAVITDPRCATDALPNTFLIGDGFCRFDRTQYRQFAPEMAHGSVSLSYQRKFGDINSYTRMAYFESRIHSQFEPNAYSGGEGFDPGDPEAAVFIFADPFSRGIVGAGKPGNPTFGTEDAEPGFWFRRLVEFGPRQKDIDTRGVRLLTGLDGTFGSSGFTWDVGLSFNRQKVDSSSPNILSSAWDRVVRSGINLFEEIPEDVMRTVRFDSTSDSASSNILLDGTLTGPVGLQLPGGMTQMSVHFDAQHEKYHDRSDPLSTLGDAFDGQTSGGGNRNYYALALEFVMPVTSWMEVGIAGRYDHYDDDSDVGGAFSPRGQIQIRPIDTLYIRGSVGKSFRAPDLQRLFGGNVKAFDSAIDTPTCVALGGTPFDDDSPFPSCFDPVPSIPIRVTSNEELEEERGTNANIGVGWEVVKNLTIKVDYYWVRLKNIVTDPSTQSILDNCALEGVFCDQIVYAASGDTNGDGQILDELGSAVFFGSQNLAEQKIKGIDAGVTYDFKVASVGRFRASYDVSWVDSLTLKLDEDDPATEQIDFASIPEFRMGGKLDWSLNNLGAFIRVDSVGDYPGAFSGEDPPKSDYFSSFTVWDLQVFYNFGKFGLVRLGVENVFDKDMPLDPTALGGNRPNQFIDSTQTVYHNAYGRSGYLQYEFSF